MSPETATYASPKELAEMFGISVSIVNRMIQEGTLPVLQFGPRTRRIDVQEAQRILRRGGADD